MRKTKPKEKTKTTNENPPSRLPTRVKNYHLCFFHRKQDLAFFSFTFDFFLFFFLSFFFFFFLLIKTGRLGLSLVGWFVRHQNKKLNEKYLVQVQ